MGDKPSEAFPDQLTGLTGEDEEIPDLIASVLESLMKRPDQAPLIRRELRKLVSTVTYPGEQEILQEIRESLEKRNLWSSLEKLTTLAAVLAQELESVSKPTREEKRSRPLLEKWYVNNWSLIKPHVENGEIRVYGKDEEGNLIDITDEVMEDMESSKNQ